MALKTQFASLLAALALCHTAVWAKGEFIASDACEAYVSSKKLTNPDMSKLEPGKSYPLLSTNQPANPDWFQVRVDSANPTARWVKAECGSASLANAAPAAKTGGAAGAACGLGGQADSYVFAVSWQPAFCESKPDKPECSIADPQVYQATHFTLHGLWPNKNACGTNYGFCGEVKVKPAEFCDYPAVGLSPEVRSQLAIVMPSVASGSCLERHEWHKHGTCQSGTPDQYYALATRLVREFNDSGIAAFMAKHIGQQVGLQAFQDALDKGLGEGASRHAKLGCKDGLLVDIYMNLPAELKPDASLKELLAQSAPAPADNTCKSGFRVDPIGQ
jgi:ribonuclease T2